MTDTLFNLSLPGAILHVVLASIASGHAILRRRDPRAALWWVGVSWVFPIAGPILYYFVGINRIERKSGRVRRFRLMPSLKPRRILSRSGDLARVSPRMRHLSALSNLVGGVVGKPLREGNRVRPLINGDEAYPEMLAAIEGARKSISMATYIFNNDDVGRQFVAALRDAVRRGVQVRVLIDDVGAGFGRASVHGALKHAGVPVALFNPTLVPWRVAYFNLRNHRKLLVIDGKRGFSGGMNIHERHVIGARSNFPTQDIHFLMEGPVVEQVQKAFCDDWYFVTAEKLEAEAWFPPLGACGTVAARGIPDGPDEDHDKIRWTLLGALAHARDSVRIVTPYFIPDQSLVTALNIAAMSGVRVDIVLPEVTDLALVQWASTATLWQVLERGCRIWMSPAPFDHSKLMLIDGGWTLFGSSNWDTRSLRLNFEFDVECYDEALTRQLETWVDGRISAAREVKLADVDARSLPMRLRDGVARLFSPHL